jgi:hypothetical protein
LSLRILGEGKGGKSEDSKGETEGTHDDG